MKSRRRHRIQDHTEDAQHKKFIRKYGKGFIENLPPRFKVLKQIGKGAFGSVYLLCQIEDDGCIPKYVLKIQKKPISMTTKKFVRDIEREVEMHAEFQSYKLAPELIADYMFYKGKQLFSVIIMKKVNVITDDLDSFPNNRSDVNEYCKAVVKGVDGIVKQMCKHGLSHGDMHNENIAFIGERALWDTPKPYKLILIDFGKAVLRKCSPSMEILQLIRTIMIDKQKFKNIDLYDCLIAHLYALYVKYVGKINAVPLDFDDIHEEDSRLNAAQEEMF